MNKVLFIIIIRFLNQTFSQSKIILTGKIVDENLTCLQGVKITNKTSGEVILTDQNGSYKITALKNDTISFEMVGLTTDNIKIERSTEPLNLIMMDKNVNDLGAIWTDKDYHQAHRQINKTLKKLYKKADKQNVWKKIIANTT